MNKFLLDLALIWNITNSSAIAKGPCDLSCQLKSCQLPLPLRKHSLITKTWDFTWPTCVQNLKSLALAVARYYMGCKILKWVTWPRPRPFQGRFFMGRVGLAMVNLCTKFEVYVHLLWSYEWRCKVQKNGVVSGRSRSWTMPPFGAAHMTSYLTLIETMCLSFAVFEI